MSQLLRIGEALQRVEGEIVAAEMSYSKRQKSRLAELELASLVSVRKELEQGFESVAASSGVEICRYSISGSGLRTAANAFSALAEFQKVVTTGFACLKHGKRSRLRFTDNDIRDSSLSFSHAMAGSLVTVLRAPVAPELFVEIEPVISEAVANVFEAAQAKDESDIRRFSDRFGKAFISAIYDWSESHSRASLIADISWMRPNGKRYRIVRQPQEFEFLNSMIRKTGGEISETITVTGTLLAASTIRKTFAFEPDDKAGEISGTYFDAIGPDHVVELPGRYKATIVRQSSTVMATDEQRQSYFLEELTPIT